jgi:hypothetical protein
MTFQINRRPLGIDDTLGAKSWPTVQTQLADQVVAVYDTTDEYRFNRKWGGNLFGGAATSGTAQRQTTAAVTVPATEAWWIDNLSVYTPVGLPVGHVIGKTTISVQEVGVGDIATTGTANWMRTNSSNWAAGEIVWEAVEPKIWFGPSSRIIANFQGSGLAAFQVYFAWTGYRVRI